MESDAATTFDPYHKWLGIPPTAQPPDHYRLVGVESFEDDPDVIASPSDRPHTHTGQQLRPAPSMYAVLFH